MIEKFSLGLIQIFVKNSIKVALDELSRRTETIQEEPISNVPIEKNR
jgi:hypothetical protein